MLDRGKFPEYQDLLDVASSNPALKNLFSGVASPAEMFLWAYSYIDGLTYSAVDDDVLDGISVEGFLRTRPYTTQMVSTLHDIILMTIWSVHSDIDLRGSLSTFRRTQRAAALPAVLAPDRRPRHHADESAQGEDHRRPVASSG